MTETVGNWPANVASCAATMYSRGQYDTGQVRDGHKLLRYEENGKTHIEVHHPAECEHLTEMVGVQMVAYACPWGHELEWRDPSELYAGDAPIEEVLPLDEEVEVEWHMSMCERWTDYGWEGDGEFAWWPVSSALGSREMTP